jgi:hypothetical protein
MKYVTEAKRFKNVTGGEKILISTGSEMGSK